MAEGSVKLKGGYEKYMKNISSTTSCQQISGKYSESK